MEFDGIITGGVAPKGKVSVSGAKNSATRLLAATLLGQSSSHLENFPTELVDVRHKVRLIREMGCQVKIDEMADTVTVDPTGLRTCDLDENSNFPIRTTYLMVAWQILRHGHARIPYPGGCQIGARGYDLHVMIWRDLGCEVIETPHFIEVRGNGFKAGKIRFPISTVGGTENALLCAAVAQGQTEIVNAYVTPEIEDLIDFLHRMGAQIELIGNSHIFVNGNEALRGANKQVMADRIEALTWIIYALMSGGEIQIDHVPFSAMEIPLIHLEKAGVDLYRNSNSVFVHPNCLSEGLAQPFELACGTHPGIISDMQPFYVLLGTIANGRSKVFDYRYPERISYVSELAKLCGEGDLEARSGQVTVNGPIRFKSGKVKSTDLRGSMALVMAALCAEGQTEIKDVHMALRGYNRLREKLDALGNTIETFEK
jgi:UDP-N-acetylglucosamine 1-carboxyvinyltransferase